MSSSKTASKITLLRGRREHRRAGDACADVVITFGILHHVEHRREALAEHRRLLRPGSLLVIEEPDAALLRGWDRIFHWDHPQAGFSLVGLEHHLQSGGLRLERRWKLPGVFGAYRARKNTSPHSA